MFCGDHVLWVPHDVLGCQHVLWHYRFVLFHHRQFSLTLALGHVVESRHRQYGLLLRLVIYGGDAKALTYFLDCPLEDSKGVIEEVFSTFNVAFLHRTVHSI
jgi:hypothetical protein